MPWIVTKCHSIILKSWHQIRRWTFELVRNWLSNLIKLSSRFLWCTERSLLSSPYRRWHRNAIRKILKFFMFLGYKYHFNDAYSCHQLRAVYEISFLILDILTRSILSSNVTILVSLEVAPPTWERKQQTLWRRGKVYEKEAEPSQRTNDDENLLYDFYDFFLLSIFSFPSSSDIKNQ